MKRAWGYYQEVSRLWRQKLRTSQAWVMPLAALAFAVVSVSLDYLMETLTPLAVGSGFDLLDAVSAVSAFGNAVLILALYAYALVAIQAVLPGVIAFALGIALAAMSHWVLNIQLWLAEHIAVALPESDRARYLNTLADIYEPARWVITVLTLTITIGGVVFQVIVLRGLLRYGDSYRTMPRGHYQALAMPHEGMWNMCVEVWRSRGAQS